MKLIEKMSNSLGEFNLSPEKFINFLNLETDPWIQLNLIETYKFIFHSYSDNTIMKNLSMELIKFHLENYSKSTGKNNNIHSMMNNIRNTNSISGHYFDFAIALFIAKIKHRDLYNILMEFIFHFIENNLEMANFIDIMSKRYYSFNQCKILSYKNKIATLYDQKCKEDTYFYSNLKEKHS